MSDIMGIPGVPFTSSMSGAKLTVSDILKQPTFVQAYLLDIADYLFVADQIFRPVQDCPSGVVVYHQSTPLFADQNASDLEEWEEIPAAFGGLGTPQTALAKRKGLAVEVSEQMQTRNNVDAMNVQLTQVQNTLIQNFDKRFMTAMDAGVVTAAGQAGGALNSHVVAAGAPWLVAGSSSAPNASWRVDLAQAAATIVTEQRGFRADTLLIDETTYYNMLANQQQWAIYVGNAALDNPQIVGMIPSQILGFRVMVTMNGNIPAGNAYLMQRGIFGGISNERPLRATPWYPIRQREVIGRSDVTRSATAFVDQPMAVAKITGVR